jgi:hypothetical protein
MLQVVAGLTVVFVGYVLYEVYKTVSSEANDSSPAKTPPPPAVSGKTERPAKAPAAQQTAASAPEPEVKKAPVEPKKPEPAVGDAKALQLKDPSSGETAPAPTNYRFAKKWIKDAIVAEGLLDKVYKAAELDDASGLKVREALEKFKALKKYHA